MRRPSFEVFSHLSTKKKYITQHIMLNRTILSLICILGLISCLTACNDKEAVKQKVQAIQVTTLKAEPTTQPYVAEVFGQTEGSKAVIVYPQVTGPVLQRHYAEGQSVKQGDVLFTIDPAPFDAANQSAEASVIQAQVELKQAEREAKRFAALRKVNAVSEKEYSDRISALESCKANLAAAKAKALQTKIQLDYTSVKAPVSGIAGRSLINPGTLVTANNSALTDITQDDQLKARFSLSDNDLHGFTITEDSPVSVVHEKTGVEVPARINFAATQIDPQTGTRSLSAEIERSAELLPGQYVTIRLTLGTQKGVYLIPQSAVRQLPDGTYSVYLYKDGVARAQSVTVGRWSGKDWIITSGLKSGDLVIIDQIQKLRDKAKVALNQDKKTASKPTEK